MRSPLPTRWLAYLGATLCLTGLVVGLSSAGPPTDETNGLTTTEVATLWSHDNDTVAATQPSQNTSTDEIPMAQLASRTDISFTRPPATAATWTRNDFTDLSAGDTETSIYPPHADLEDGALIEDAHVTVFAVHPSTRAYRSATESDLYVAPTGSLRAFVDYRVRLPQSQVNTSPSTPAPNGTPPQLNTSNSSPPWRVTNHEIEEVRLLHEGELLTRTEGTHTPVLDYDLAADGATTLTVEADIAVRVGNGVSTRTEELTVTDSVDVVVYDLEAYPYTTTYPNGDSGIAVFQTQPWQGYSLDEDTDSRVRGVWRFYTARDRQWDTLTVSTTTDDESIDSPARPVYVHAYPSRIGPRAEPVRDGPEILDVWGRERPSPAATLGSNVNVGVVEQSYTPSYGVAVRADDVDIDDLRVTGIVRGVNATIIEPDTGATRTVRESNLSVSVVSQNSSGATLRIELRDGETDDPIVLAKNDRLNPVGDDTRPGYITIAGERVDTNTSGVALVTVDQPGIYTARYHPGSWLSVDPAYTPATASARWHPLTTIAGWVTLIDQVLWLAVPFAVALYAGRRLLTLLPGSRIGP